MLYIFHVDTGTMMTFDMSLAVESVMQLKDSIERTCRIPIDKQVLLVSGGDSLDPTARVYSYSAGTDTNPIYLFSKSIIEGTTPPAPSCGDSGSDMEMKEQVDGSLSMPATYNTVVVRCQLAQQFCELAREQTRVCERLVHDQHLQQQGWSAVVANLEDITVLFQSHAGVFEESFGQYLGSRRELMTLVGSFSEDLLALSKIPIVPVLLKEDPQTPPAKDAASSDESVKLVGGGGGGRGELSPVTLLQWISVADDQSNLEEISDACTQGLEKFDERVLAELKEQIQATLEGANKTDYKEIKGLEERLFGLEELMYETKRIVQEQSDLAQSFLQNQNRASNLGDPSILPDLCASHRRQLQVMLKNHQQLRDIRRRCSKAKEELCINLYHRLRWITYVENNMVDLERRLNLYHDGLKRLRRRLNVVQQIHLAPSMYLTAVGEVVRRRTFSQAFLMWASDVARQLLTVHTDEVTRRQEFQSQFDGHFLNVLFPGLEDAPPPFATQAPPPFDARLPPLTAADIARLREQIPDVAAGQSWPDLAAITQFFLVKVKPDSMNERLIKSMAEAESVSSPTNYMMATLKQQDSRGFESETDTEDFEKVTSTSPMDVAFDAKQPPLSESGNASSAVISALEERLGAACCETDRLRTLAAEAGRRAGDAASLARDELSVLRCQVAAQRDAARAVCRQLLAAMERLAVRHAAERGEREGRQRLAVDQELEIEMLKKEIKVCAEVKEEEIRRLKQTTTCQEREMNELRADMERRLEEEVRERRDVARSLETELNETRQHCTQLQIRLEASELDKQRAVKEVTDRLALDYKTELERLRSNFRLMATVASDSSLEKMAGRAADAAAAERTNQEALLEAARKEEAAKWEARLEGELRLAKTRTDQEKQVWFNEAMRRVVGDKDRQLEALRARETSLVAECLQHQETIQRITARGRGSGGSAESGTMVWPLLDRVELLEAENNQLEAELAGRARRKDTSESDASCEMNCSVALVPECSQRDAATSPDQREDPDITQKLTQSANALVAQGKISIMSCNAGDAVLVWWNEEHNNYTILQEVSTLYFLHADCAAALGLAQEGGAGGGGGRRPYATAEVVEKEYCHAKKSENRYRVPKGTKFYRVKVRPLPKDSLMTRSHHHHHHHHHSSPISAAQSGTL